MGAAESRYVAGRGHRPGQWGQPMDYQPSGTGRWPPLAGAGLCLIALIAMNRLGVIKLAPYLIVGLILLSVILPLMGIMTSIG